MKWGCGGNKETMTSTSASSSTSRLSALAPPFNLKYHGVGVAPPLHHNIFLKQGITLFSLQVFIFIGFLVSYCFSVVAQYSLCYCLRLFDLLFVIIWIIEWFLLILAFHCLTLLLFSKLYNNWNFDHHPIRCYYQVIIKSYHLWFPLQKKQPCSWFSW